MTERITSAAFRDMIINASAAISSHRDEINELNVFPVPDGDTGTNMSMTFANGSNAVAGSAPGTVSRAAEIAAGAFLRGARGNSGVILSLLFRGVSKGLKDLESADAKEFAAALKLGVDTAYKAVMKPSEGTILTVSRIAADAAEKEAEENVDVEAVLEAALREGWVALDNTIEQNPILKKAGVVDAGGKGYLYILDGMLRSLRGETCEAGTEPAVKNERADFSSFDNEDIKFTYCTEFIVERRLKKDVSALRDFLDARGDSIVVVDDEDVIKVHIHSNEPGNIITEALTYGPLLTVKIENMREQHTAKVVDSFAPAKPAEPEKKYGIVSVCAGEGLESVFSDIGVDGIITGGQTMNPSTDDILKKIEAVSAETVFVLPNNKNIIMAAQQCIPIASKNVVVIPTKTVPQGISAVLAFDGDADVEDNTSAMEEAAANVHTVMVTYAARDSEFDGHSIKANEYLALLEGSLLINSSSPEEVASSIAGALKEFSPEIITVFYGSDVSADGGDEFAAKLSEYFPDAEVSAVSGGQPVYYFMISAE